MMLLLRVTQVVPASVQCHMVSVCVYVLACVCVSHNEMHRHIIIAYVLGSGCNVCKCMFHNLSDENVIL